MLYKRFAGKLFSQLHCIEIGHGFIAMKIQIFIFMFVKLVCAINVSITRVLLLGWAINSLFPRSNNLPLFQDCSASRSLEDC